MRDWRGFVRARLPLPDLAPERELRIVREVAAQLEDLYRDALAGGASEPEADARVVAHVGDWTRLAADLQQLDRPHRRPAVDRLVRDLENRPVPAPGGSLMVAHTLRDLRYAVRQLAAAPGFTAVAVLTLALGIGATTAIFSVVNGVLLRPLPYPESSELVRVHEIVPQFGRFSVAPANFLDWRAQNTVFERIAAYSTTSATLLGPDGPLRIPGALVSWDVFPVLRVAPAIGRPFTAADDAPGADATVILSHALWLDRCGGDPGIFGRSISMNGVPVTVVGVMPAGFHYPARDTAFWRPLNLNPADATRGGHYLGVVARLRAGVRLDRADLEMRTLAQRLAVEYPKNSAGESAVVVSLQDQVVGAIRPALLTLFAAVGFVVLIACANVANLLLVRASAREKEMAIRAALGASSRRLVGQMLAESLVLAAAGGALGIAFAHAALGPILSLGAKSIPRVADVALDSDVLVFAAAASIVTGLLFGLAPAWQVSHGGLVGVLKEGGRSSGTGGARWVRSTLLVAEVALSIVLLTGAALLLRSFDRLTGVDPGFNPDGVLAFQVSLPQKAYAEAGRTTGFYDALTGRLEAEGDVRGVGLVQTLPLRGSYELAFDIRGRAPASPGAGPSAHYRAVSPHYLDVLGVPLAKGRGFAASDGPKNQPVAIVDRAFADKYFPSQNAIGQGLHIGNGVSDFFTIVGIAGNVRSDGLDATPVPTMYVPIAQDTFSTVWVVARAAGDPASLAGSVRRTLHDIDPALAAYSITPLRVIVNESIAPQRFAMLLLALFAGVALFLAAVGLYGVVAYSVSRRTREIGLRMAIGADPGQVVRMIVGGGVRLALLGVAIGVAGAFVLSRLLRTLLFEVTPSDPISYAATAALLLAIATLACYVPARRALRVDPLVALQSD
jgi:putative ABC transport system permease protein